MSAASSPAPVEPAALPVGAGEYVVSEAECLNSIAERFGFFWQTLWNHPENQELRRRRNDHNILLPGDRIHIPERNLKQIDAATDRRHSFRRKGTPSMLRLRLLDHDSPETYAHKPYTVTIDGTTRKGRVDSEGYVEFIINPAAQSGLLAVGDEGDQELFDFRIAGIDPIQTARGAQQRLYNLGFFMLGMPGNEWTDEAIEALKQFQSAYLLTNDDTLPTGLYDSPTQEKLREIHGC